MKNMLIIAASETDANLYYATEFLAPDPFIYFSLNGKSTLLMSDLEVDRAKATAKVNEVLSLSEEANRLKKNANEQLKTTDTLARFLIDRGVHEVTVPDDFAVGYADSLRSLGLTINVKSGIFFEERLLKKSHEIEHLKVSLQATEESMAKAINIIRESEIRGNDLYWQDERLTSEILKKMINVYLMENDCVAEHTILACGEDSCDPHNEGRGGLKAHQTIVIDIFPRSATSRYYADMTRTVVKGKASERIKKMFNTVREGQEIAYERVKDGVDGSGIHRAITDHFNRQGFPTGLIKGRYQGFFHGTGHGVGLEIHEPPRISSASYKLCSSNVVTVEPGLYYPDLGGIRLEDMVVVKDNGVEVLTQMEKVLEIE